MPVEIVRDCNLKIWLLLHLNGKKREKASIKWDDAAAFAAAFAINNKVKGPEKQRNNVPKDTADSSRQASANAKKVHQTIDIAS